MLETPQVQKGTEPGFPFGRISLSISKSRCRRAILLSPLTLFLLQPSSSQTHLPAVLRKAGLNIPHTDEPCGPDRALLLNAGACSIRQVLQQ